MKKKYEKYGSFGSVFCAVAVLFAFQANASIVLQDDFNDGDRTANEAWYLVKAQSTASVVDGALNFNNEHSGSNPTTAPYAQKGIVANFNTVSLNPGDSLSLSFDFSLQSVVDQSGYFRFGLAYDDPSNGTPFAGDGATNGGTVGDDDYSYFVGMSSGANTGLAIREDNGTSNGFMAGGDIVSDKGSGSYTLNDTDTHSVVFTIARSATEARRDFTVEIDGVEVATGYDDWNLKVDFNEVGFVSAHRDLDFTLDNVQVEVVPEPATMGLVGLFGGMIALLRRFHVC